MRRVRVAQGTSGQPVQEQYIEACLAAVVQLFGSFVAHLVYAERASGPDCQFS